MGLNEETAKEENSALAKCFSFSLESSRVLSVVLELLELVDTDEEEEGDGAHDEDSEVGVVADLLLPFVVGTCLGGVAPPFMCFMVARFSFGDVLKFSDSDAKKDKKKLV